MPTFKLFAPPRSIDAIPPPTQSEHARRAGETDGEGKEGDGWKEREGRGE